MTLPESLSSGGMETHICLFRIRVNNSTQEKPASLANAISNGEGRMNLFSPISEDFYGKVIHG
jgi:hypothetical protein